MTPTPQGLSLLPLVALREYLHQKQGVLFSLGLPTKKRLKPNDLQGIFNPEPIGFASHGSRFGGCFTANHSSKACWFNRYTNVYSLLRKIERWVL